jgi:solute carrier family 25 phosphate transporter 23/24/25/41
MALAQKHGNELETFNSNRDPSSSLKRSIAGGISAGMGKTITAPLERLRIIRQAGAHGGAKVTTLLSSIYQNEGVRGLWKGNAVNLTRVVPSYAVRFTAFGRLSEYKDVLPILGNPFVTGAVAGTASALASYPLEVLRTRISLKGSLREAFAKGGLFAGCSLTILETTPYSALTLGTYNYLGKNYPAKSTKGKIIHGIIAGTVGTVICFPIDTLRRNKMVHPTVRVLDVAKSLYSEGMISRYYRGLTVAVLKAAPTVALTMTMNDYLLLQLGVT